jgi:hypothetical protein
MCSFRYDGNADLTHRVIDGAVPDIACSLSGRPWQAYRWRGRSTAGPSHFAAWEQPKLVGEDGWLQGPDHPQTRYLVRSIRRCLDYTYGRSGISYAVETKTCTRNQISIFSLGTLASRE